MRKLLASLILVCAATSSFAACEEFYLNSRKPLQPDASRIELCRIAYEVMYSYDLKVSLYAAEHLIPERMTQQEKRLNNFRADRQLPKGKRAEPSDYLGSGFDRGHLAAAENMRIDKQALSESFLLSNMVPQEPTHNENIWRRLELQVITRVRRGEPAYVLTGPLFYGEDERIGRSGVSVPKALWKVVIWPQSVQAWLIPNMPNLRGKPDEYLVPLPELESKLGFKVN